MIRPLRDVLSSFTINVRRAGAWAIGFAVVMVLTPLALGQTYQIIHRFAGGDGQHPSTGLSIDATGRTLSSNSRNGVQTDAFGLELGLEYAAHLPGRYGRIQSWRASDYRSRRQSVWHHVGRRQPGLWTQFFRLRPPLNACKAALCPWAETILHAFAGSDGKWTGRRPSL